ncbi:hypothetical protein KC799_01080, partial [candidate division KSB1 bacterium]|nr:hypothetical protein [candidate division KSB1 bacterium]
RHVYKDNFSRYLQRFQPGDSLHFSVIRNEYLRVFTLVLQPPPTEMQTIKLVPMKNPTALQLKIRDSWAGKLRDERKD